jgi:hypothetical protein
MTSLLLLVYVSTVSGVPAVIVYLLRPLQLLMSLMLLTSLSLMLFPAILASLFLLASPDGPVASCAAVGLAFAVILTAVVSSLGSLLWLKSQQLLPSQLLAIADFSSATDVTNCAACG